MRMHNNSECTSTVEPAGNTGILVFVTLVLCAAFGEFATGLIVPAV
jgi:hypothetical protein